MWGLQNRDREYWTTDDMRNDIAVRKFREFVLRNVRLNHALSLHDMVAEKTLEHIDFNRPSVASEIAGLLYEFWKRTGADTVMSRIFSAIDTSTSAPFDLSETDYAYWHPRNIPDSISLIEWFTADKSSETQRLLICNLLLEALRGFRAAVINQTCRE
jgi:hypothetical protein